MRYSLGLPLVLILAFFCGCAAQKPLEPVAVLRPARAVNYLHEVQPILNKRCVVCHSCYNSPCQLKMNSFEGVERGASKQKVYNALRLKTMDPTRLFVDAHSADAWRKKGFSSVVDSNAGEGFNNSLLLQLLAHKKAHPASTGDYFPEADDLTCAANGNELGLFLDKHPNRGMPFGFPPLKEEEYQIIADWLVAGAPGPTPEEQAALVAIPIQDLEKVSSWEEFLNRADAKHLMTARYLYEHLFLGHITFSQGSGAFYELVRSRTPSGKDIEIIPSVRPYDDPGGPFYYRFRRIHEAIVNKTHIVIDLGGEKLQRVHDLFIKPDWLMTPYQAGYLPLQSANPFTTLSRSRRVRATSFSSTMSSLSSRPSFMVRSVRGRWP